MVRNAQDAVAAALAQQTNVPDTCQLTVRTWLDAPSAGDRDHDGDADAVDGWLSEPLAARHTDRDAPAGHPVAWSGGSSGHGHRALSLGKVHHDGITWIRSTDAGGSGHVATVPLSWVEKTWGLTYLGWSDTIDGLPIPPAPKEPPVPTKPPTTPGHGHGHAALLQLVVVVAFVNAGRGPLTKVRGLWSNLAGLAHRLDVILAVEVDEGDKGYSDHGLIRRLVHGFTRAVFRKHREVTLVRDDHTVKRAWWARAGQAVAHWSPVRGIAGVLVVSGAGIPDVLYLVLHRAAGTGVQAKNRPGWARPLLAASAAATDRALKRKVRSAHRKGKHVVVCLDANAPHYPQPHPKAVVLFAARPDFGYAVPAPGWVVGHVDLATFPNPIEPKLHPGHIATVTFQQAP